MNVLLLFASFAMLSVGPQQESMEQLTQRVFSSAKVQLSAMSERVAENAVPVTFEHGAVKDTKITTWTSGFFPGSLWYVYEYTGDQAIKELALKETEKLMGLHKLKTHHDIGFQINCSVGNAYRLTGEERYLEQMRVSAIKLQRRFIPAVGCTQSWAPRKNARCPVIVDNMMNLELLMNTYNILGGDSLKTVACTHANTTMKNHFRPDGSSYHMLAYDPQSGEVERKVTVQGFCDESAWSRGQSWGLYGYTMMYRETRDEAYLEMARKIAAFIIPMLPEDGVPYWDFNAPGTPHAMTMADAGAPSAKDFHYKDEDIVYRDASAGAIIASSLIELSTYTDSEQGKLYLQTAEKILRTLASPEYFTPKGNGNFLLKHSVTNLHKWKGVDIPLTYADYYFLEALLRYDRLHKKATGSRVMARFVPEREDDFVFENDLVAGRIYGQALEHETLSPGIDIWVKLPGELIAEGMYKNKLSYHKFNGRGKDCYKVGKSLGAGASALVIDGKLIYPKTNYRSYEILSKSDDKVVFVLHYPQWEYRGEKISLDKKITVSAGSRFVRVDDTYRFSGPISKAEGGKLVVAAGVTRHSSKKTVVKDYAQNGRVAIWEKASDTKAEPESGFLGIGVYAPKAEYAGLSKDSSHSIVSQKIKSGKAFTYYFGNCWSRADIKTAEEWFEIVKAIK